MKICGMGMAIVCLLVVGRAMGGDELPQEASILLDELDEQVAAIQAKADAEIKQRTEKYIASLQKLQDDYTLAAKLDEAVAIRDQIRALKAGPLTAEQAPQSMMGIVGKPGQRFYFEATGATGGAVWGDEIYTDDSNLATAAVHAGVLRDGQTGVIAVTLLPGSASYEGTSRKGVTSLSFPNYPRSYRIDPAVGIRTRTMRAAQATGK